MKLEHFLISPLVCTCVLCDVVCCVSSIRLGSATLSHSHHHNNYYHHHRHICKYYITLIKEDIRFDVLINKKDVGNLLCAAMLYCEYTKYL